MLINGEVHGPLVNDPTAKVGMVVADADGKLHWDALGSAQYLVKGKIEKPKSLFRREFRCSLSKQRGHLSLLIKRPRQGFREFKRDIFRHYVSHITNIECSDGSTVFRNFKCN